MYRLTSQDCRKVQVKEAEQFLAINNFKGQRELNPLKARLYADKMENGTMRPVHVAIATLPDGKKVLMNGQHVCTAITIHGKPHSATVEYYKCDDWDDAWHLYASFDIHASRTERHVMKAARGLFKNEALRDLPLAILQSCGTAIAILGSGKKPIFKLRGIEKTAKAEAVDNYPEDVIWVASFVEFVHLIRVGVVAAMIATHRANESKAEEFWRLVGSGIGITSKDSPAYKLREALISVRRSNSVSCGSEAHFDNYCTSIAWWNSFVNGERRTAVKLAAMNEAPDVSSGKQ